MKKALSVLLLSLLMVLAMVCTAAAECPGQQVTVPVYVNNSVKAVYVQVQVSGDFSNFTINSFTGLNGAQANPGNLQCNIASEPLPDSFQIATITMTIKDTAPAGTYSFSASVMDAYDASLNTVYPTAYTGSVTVTDHNWVAGETVAPTCDDEGYTTYTCACGATKKDNIKGKLGHEGVWVEVTPATCIAEGTEKQYCERPECKYYIGTMEMFIQSRPIAKKDHTWGEWVQTVAPTCTSTGVKERVCTVTGCTARETEDVQPLSHTMEDVAAKAPTCTEDGWEAYKKCANCDATDPSPIVTLPATGHGDSLTTYPAVPATCTESGLTYGEKCAKCGHEVKQEEIPALGHDWKDIPAKDPTCTDPGCTAGRECQRPDCGLVEGCQPIDPLGHTVVIDPYVAPTCTTDGRSEGKHCSACGEVLLAQQILPALDHDIVADPAVPATCVATGLTAGEHCTRCDYKIAQDVVPVDPTAHKPGDDVQRQEPTCTEDGWESFKCTLCGTDVDKKIIPALNHDMGAYVQTKAPTCSEKGEEKSSCSRCDHFVTREINALGHDMSAYTTSQPATCTEKGEEKSVCSRCDHFLTREVAALGHDMSAYTTSKPATCTEKGEEKSVCSRCDHFLTREVAALGHNWDDGVEILAPTCTETGEKLYSCTRCDATDVKPIAAKGHTPGAWVVTRPVTADQPGEKELRCSVCDVLLETAIIPNSIYYHMTVSSIGPRFRDVSGVTTKWDMFTAIDLSVEGVQIFDLIAGNIHVIGQLIVTVENGFVTIDYTLISNEIDVKSEFLSIFSSLADVTTLNEDALTSYAFGQPISIADELGGDASVLIYVHNRCHYRDDIPGLRDFDEDSPVYAELLTAMDAFMN